jgi:putative FmdB family regulatory protein
MLLVPSGWTAETATAWVIPGRITGSTVLPLRRSPATAELSWLGDPSMPTYEYKCMDCNHVFSLPMSIPEHETAKVECPQCKGTNVKWHPAPFFAVTSKKS